MTLISHDREFIFLKTHKTASTSVEAAFEPLCLPPGASTGMHYRDMSVTEHGVVGARGEKYADRPWRNHMSARNVRRGIGRPVWRRYFKFSTVRNPFDRAVSMFHWRQTPEARERLKAAPFDEVRSEFHDWLRTAELRKNLNKICIGPRYILDDVIRYERLDEDFERIAARVGLPATELARYKSGQRRADAGWTAYYDDASRNLVARRCAFELAYFGYGFEGLSPGRSFASKALSLAVCDPLRFRAGLRNAN